LTTCEKDPDASGREGERGKLEHKGVPGVPANIASSRAHQEGDKWKAQNEE
jgi:hypothetical protein